jgi:hypothetical protein
MLGLLNVQWNACASWPAHSGAAERRLTTDKSLRISIYNMNQSAVAEQSVYLMQ